MLIRVRLLIQVLENGVVVHKRSHHHKQVPDGVSKGYLAVRLEETNAHNVQHPANLQLVHALEVVSVQDEHQRRPDAHHQVQARLQTLVPFVVELLVDDAQGRQQPHHCVGDEQDRGMRGRGEAQPRVVGARDKDVDHCTVAAVQQVLQAAVLVAIMHDMEDGGDGKEQRQSGSIDERRDLLRVAVAAPEQLQSCENGRHYP